MFGGRSPLTQSFVAVQSIPTIHSAARIISSPVVASASGRLMLAPTSLKPSRDWLRCSTEPPSYFSPPRYVLLNIDRVMNGTVCWGACRYSRTAQPRALHFVDCFPTHVSTPHCPQSFYFHSQPPCIYEMPLSNGSSEKYRHDRHSNAGPGMLATTSTVGVLLYCTCNLSDSVLVATGDSFLDVIEDISGT